MLFINQLIQTIHCNNFIHHQKPFSYPIDCYSPINILITNFIIITLFIFQVWWVIIKSFNYLIIRDLDQAF